MLHRAMFGSLERFTGIMIEHYAGHLPLWLSPLQAVIATITSDADDYAREAIAAAKRLGLRVEGDLRNEKINYKVREHSLAKVPVLLVVGRKEAAERTVSIRRLGSEKQEVMTLEEAIDTLAQEAVPPDVRRVEKIPIRPVRTLTTDLLNAASKHFEQGEFELAAECLKKAGSQAESKQDWRNAAIWYELAANYYKIAHGMDSVEQRELSDRAGTARRLATS
jgi:tetratricopeptide (TPR) repeat protein